MEKKTVVIVGGVAGGASAAARLRRRDENVEVILVERGPYVSYANCGLPYYLGGVISEREKLFVQTAEGFRRRFNIDIRTRQEVESISPAEHKVKVKDLEKGETYDIHYDKLVLSPGAEPVRPPLKGLDSKRVFTLRNVNDTDAIYNFMQTAKPRRAVVVGGGFIGLEVAENLKHAGIDVAIVEMADQVMAPLDFSMAAIVHQHLEAKGVKLHLSSAVEQVEETAEGLLVGLKGGEKLPADMVVLSIGVRPETRLATDCGLKIGVTRGIAVNDFMQTSDPDIYAVGDAVEVKNPITGGPALIPLAGPANKQGRIVADNIVDGNIHIYKGTIGTSVAKVFDLTVAAAGMAAKRLKKEGIASYHSEYVHSSSHAGYYPKALPLCIKIVFSPENGRLLGAQVVGAEGADKRIEMLASVIQRGGTVTDLAEIEQAYAPPFAAAKDPVNMVGFVGENVMEGKVKTIHWRDVEQALKQGAVGIDVRTADEFALGNIPGFKNIPLDDLRERMSEVPRDRMVILSCAIGLRGYMAYRILTQHGYTQLLNLSGGYRTWCTSMAPVCNPSSICDSTSNSGACNSEAKSGVSLSVDACGLMCPGPIMKLKSHYAELVEGQTLEISATDPAFQRDVASWCNVTGATLEKVENEQGIVKAVVRKQAEPSACIAPQRADGKTLIVFSDDLDKAIASFVLANGAAAMGKKVTMFFTFWGLNVIKKREKPSVKKDIFGRMFGMMMPTHSGTLKLSKMNMLGAGRRMMRYIMNKKKILSLEEMMAQAQAAGIEMIACTMSMDVMGVKKEELIDGVILGGVANYMERAEEANVNLFV